MSDLKERIAEQEALIAVCSDPTLVSSLQADLATLRRLDAEASGEAVSEFVDGDDINRSVSKLRADRGKAEVKYLDKLSSRDREEAFRRNNGQPDYSWDSDPLRIDENKLLNRYETELRTVDAKLIELQGAATFRVGFPENELIDSCFSPALLPVRSLSTIFETLVGDSDSSYEVENMADLIWGLGQHMNKDAFIDFIDPIIKLAQKQASLNKAKSDKYLIELRKTPFDVFCKRLDRIIIRVAKKVNMVFKDQEVPSIEALKEAIIGTTFSHTPEAIDLEKERRDCGNSWDDSIMPTIKFLVESDIITVAAMDVKSGLDLKELEELYAKMNVTLAHQTPFFTQHPNEEYRQWAADFNLFRKKKEELRLLINSLRTSNAKRAGSPVRKPITK